MFILVAYASDHGSTRGVAARIAARLVEAGSGVDLRPVDEVADIAGYDAVVVGSAVHDQAWLPAAVRFVLDNRAALASRPVWLFSVGMPGALPRPLRRLAMGEGPKVIAGFHDAVGPRGHRLFTGAVRPEHLPRLGRLLFRLVGGRYGDFRNWPEIDAWAREIAAALAERSPGRSRAGA